MRERELKCKDLMVGDYVQDEDGDTRQIYGVGKDYVLATYEGNEGDSCYFNNEDNRLYGIELNGQILKNNGWAERSWGYAIRYCRASDDIENAPLPHLIEYTDSNILKIFLNYIDGGDGSDVYSFVPVTYIHDLQHALRLVGLNEIADNLKI